MSKEAEVFRERLKMLREESGMTQQDLASVLNITRTSVSGYERGDRKPEFDMIIKIANTFNKPVDYLLGRTEIDNCIDNNLITFLSNLKTGNIENLIQRWYSNNRHEQYTFNEGDIQIDEMLKNFIRLLYSLLQINEYDSENIDDSVRLILSTISIRQNSNFQPQDYRILLSLIHTYYEDVSISKFVDMNDTERKAAMDIGKYIAKLPTDLSSTLQSLTTCIVNTVTTKSMMEQELNYAYSLIDQIETIETVKQRKKYLEDIIETYNKNFNITMMVIKTFYEQYTKSMEGD